LKTNIDWTEGNRGREGERNKGSGKGIFKNEDILKSIQEIKYKRKHKTENFFC